MLLLWNSTSLKIENIVNKILNLKENFYRSNLSFTHEFLDMGNKSLNAWVKPPEFQCTAAAVKCFVLIYLESLTKFDHNFRGVPTLIFIKYITIMYLPLTLKILRLRKQV